MKRTGFFTWLFIVVLCGLICLLGWNCYRVYQSERNQAQGRVESALKSATDLVQNYNGSLGSNFARMLIDNDYSDKVAFAAGFTHNRGKMAKYFFDDDQLPPVDPNNKPIIVDTAFLHKEKLTYKPAAVMGVPQFDSVFQVKLHEYKLNIKYSIHRSGNIDTSSSDSIVSSQFILDFAQPRIYTLHYLVPRTLVLKNMIAYLSSTLLVCVLLIGGTLFFYRGLQLQVSASQFRESLVSNIAHELKTPLSSLRLIVDEAEKRAGHSGSASISAKHINFANSEINRMKLIVDRILSFSKMSKDQFAFNEERVILDKVVRDAIMVMELTAERVNGTIHYEKGPELAVDGDPVLLVNAVSAVIDNALKYSGEAPVVRITVLKEKGAAVVAIGDNGPGIPKQFRNKVFDPFFRVSTGNVYSTAGHGLGLSLVKQIMKLHGGTVTFNSSDEGTIFYLKFERS